jgi:hypothetical protein
MIDDLSYCLVSGLAFPFCKIDCLVLNKNPFGVDKNFVSRFVSSICLSVFNIKPPRTKPAS